MCYQGSGSLSVIWDRGDAHLSHSSPNSEISQFIVLKVIWPSSGTFQHRHQLTSVDTSAPAFAAATLSVYTGESFIALQYVSTAPYAAFRTTTAAVLALYCSIFSVARFVF